MATGARIVRRQANVHSASDRQDLKVHEWLAEARRRPLFAKLVQALPAALTDKDRHGIINRLAVDS